MQRFERTSLASNQSTVNKNRLERQGEHVNHLRKFVHDLCSVKHAVFGFDQDLIW